MLVRTIVTICVALVLSGMCAIRVAGQTTETAGIPVATPNGYPPAGPVTPEQIGNGIWWRPTLDDAAIEKTMADIEGWGYRNILVESFWNGETIFASQTFPSKDGSDKDWLTTMCAVARRHNLRVHAWIHI